MAELPDRPTTWPLAPYAVTYSNMRTNRPIAASSSFNRTVEEKLYNLPPIPKRPFGATLKGYRTRPAVKRSGKQSKAPNMPTPEPDPNLIAMLEAGIAELINARRDDINQSAKVIEFPRLGYAIVPTPAISGMEDEGVLNDALAAILTQWGVPKSLHREMAAEFERIARAKVKPRRRPKWDERGKYAELKDLSAPAFLKRVYADVLAVDGSIKSQTVRDIDPKLMNAVNVYVSTRKGREQDEGDAKGLRLIAGPTSALKAAKLG